MKSESLSWQTYTLGVLLTIVMATSGIAWNGVGVRLSKVETTQERFIQENRTTAVEIAVLQETLKALTASLVKLDASQTILLNKVEALVESISRDSRRWNATMDRYDPPAKKK